MRSLYIEPQTTPLRGVVTVPGDKSISHRAIMLGALAEGTSYIRHWLPAGDTLTTLAAFRQLGINIEVDEHSPTAWDLQIEGRGLHGLRQPNAPIDCKNAGTGLRLLAGILCGQTFPSTLDGSPQLRQRPMQRITTPLAQMGANISSQNGTAPLKVMPAKLHGIRYQMPVASAQVKSAVLLAGLYASGETAVYQPGPARDHSERMLNAMGVVLTEQNGWVTLPYVPQRLLTPLKITVPADISSAAFVLVAAAIIPHSHITLTGVGINDTRTGLLDMMELMGADITVKNKRQSGGEPIAELSTRFEELHAADIGGEMVIRGIDEFPILTVAATQAAGITTVRDAAELRVKEVDRITMLAGELHKMGVKMDEQPDGYTLSGPHRLHGATVNSHDDHRLGMALAIAGLAASSPTIVENADCIADSFPGFVETMCELGAKMELKD